MLPTFLSVFPPRFAERLTPEAVKFLDLLTFKEVFIEKVHQNTGYIDYILPQDFPAQESVVFWQDECKRFALSFSIRTHSMEVKGENKSEQWLSSVITIFQRATNSELWVVGKNYNGAQAGLPTVLANWGDESWNTFNSLITGKIAKVEYGLSRRSFERSILSNRGEQLKKNQKPRNQRKQRRRGRRIWVRKAKLILELKPEEKPFYMYIKEGKD